MKTVDLIKIFIASPGDVSNERNAVEMLIWKWNNEHTDSREVILMPIRWEKNSTPSYRHDRDGQGVINEQLLDDSDILIAIFGNKIGSKTRNGQSGTIEEIEYFHKKNKSGVGVFFIEKDNIPKELISNYREVQDYKKELEMRYNGLYSTFEEDKIRLFLTREVNALIVSKVEKNTVNNSVRDDISAHNKNSILSSNIEKERKTTKRLIFSPKINLKEKESKDKLIGNLEKSMSFQATHDTISKLNKYLGSFSQEEIKRLNKAGTTNDQIFSISNDPDVEQFYLSLINEYHNKY